MAYPDAYSRQSEALSGRTEALSLEFPSDFLLKSFSFDCIIGNERPAAAGKPRRSPQKNKEKDRYFNMTLMKQWDKLAQQFNGNPKSVI